MAARGHTTALVAGIGTLAGILGTVAETGDIGAALVVLVFLMFCGTVAALTALAAHLADRTRGLKAPRRSVDRRRSGGTRDRRGAARLTRSAPREDTR